jgi:hypothetical protein
METTLGSTPAFLMDLCSQGKTRTRRFTVVFIKMKIKALVFFFFFFKTVPRIEPRASHMLGKHSVTELYSYTFLFI